MARKSNDSIEPDIDDFDGQAAITIPNDGEINGGETGTGENTGAIGVDPASIGGDDIARDADGNARYNKDGSVRKKRGRKSGSGNAGFRKGNREDLKASIDTLANMIGFAHIGIATISRCPEMALEDNEAKAMAGATARVLEVFEVRPDPKIEALVGLAVTIGPIYGARFFMIRNRLAKEKAEKQPQTDGANIFPLGNHGYN